jgi:hypothetical protein
VSRTREHKPPLAGETLKAFHAELRKLAVSVVAKEELGFAKSALNPLWRTYIDKP